MGAHIMTVGRKRMARRSRSEGMKSKTWPAQGDARQYGVSGAHAARSPRAGQARET